MKKIISGKVRDVYEINDEHLVIVATDRISAFDVILSKPVKDKGKILTALSLFWFDYTKDIIRNHVISGKLCDLPVYFQNEQFEGRAILAQKLRILPFEFIVRGYIFGNMWKSYERGEDFCGLKITGDYQQAQKLDSPILTPSTKVSEGHDVCVSYDYMVNELGKETSEKISNICFKLYETCCKRAYENGIIIADTKFEFGLDKDNNLVLADEIFTPDSSRFWSVSDYKVGESPKSYDKQFIRDWLTNSKINEEIQFDNVPDDIIEKTSNIYKECFHKITNVL